MKSLNSTQKSLFVGTLLGDGNLSTGSNGKSWRYRVIHQYRHSPYVWHKYYIVQDMCQTSPVDQWIFDHRTNKYYGKTYFNTLTDDRLNYYGKLFYKKNSAGKWIKHVPDNIETLLTPLAVAYWYMDDGSLKWKGKSNAMRLCTDSFTRDNVFLLRDALNDRYGIETSVFPKQADAVNDLVFDPRFANNTGYRLAINEANSNSFKNLIKGFVVPCMSYKIPNP